MTICDVCKRVESHRIVMHYTLGLHYEGKPVIGYYYLCAEIDLCDECKTMIDAGILDSTGERPIFALWDKLKNHSVVNPNVRIAAEKNPQEGNNP